MRQSPVVVQNRQTWGQDDVTDNTRGIPIPLETIGEAVDTRTHRGVKVVVESWVVGAGG